MSAWRLRPATSEDRQLAFLWLAAALSSLALRPVWLALAPNLRPCVFRSLTGFPCPTCGTTRAATSFLNGDVCGAFAVNPLATIFGLVFVVGGLLAGLWAIARWPVPRPDNPLPLGLRIAVIGIIAANWIYLIVRA